MKTIRQKRIEDDNNKEWAQVRYSKLTTSDRSLPNFDNTQYWNGLSESSTWITNGTRGVALPDPYYNGQKVSDDYTTPIEDLLLHIGYMKAMTIELGKWSSGISTAIGGSVAISAFLKAAKDFYGEYLFESAAWDSIKASLAGTVPWKDTISAVAALVKDYWKGMYPALFTTCILWLIGVGLIAGNTYKDIYDAWNSFEQDSINAQHKVDTEVDEDGNPLWSGYQVKYNIDYGNTTTTQSSAMKLFKYHQLKRGRYQSKAYSKSNVVYTFNYTKSITYIPA